MSANVNAAAAASAAASKLGVMRLDAEYKHPNTMTVQELFDSSASQALGRSDFTQPLKLLASHLVETVADLRLLVVENQLRELGLPIRLCVWIEEEIAKLSGAVGGVSVTVPTTTSATAALPPIILSAPVPPRPSSTALNLPSSLSIPSALSPANSSPEKVAIFQFHYDFDTCGLVYYLGTKGGTQPWSNPMDAGLVTVTSSGLGNNSTPLSAIVGRETVRCVTSAGDVPSFMQIEFHDFYCKPTNYTLKHYSTYDTECLRDWKLEGSVDGLKWILIKEHKADTNLNSKGGTCTWSIQPDEPRNYNQVPSTPNSANSALSPHLLTPSLALSSLNHWYRFFRITMLGPNSNQHLYLACSGFEIYGYVLSKTQMTSWIHGNGSVASIPTWMSVNYPPWPLPKDGVLNIQQNLQNQEKAKGLVASASADDLNSTLDGDDDDFKIPSSLSLAGQLSNLSFADGTPGPRDGPKPVSNGMLQQGLFTYSSDFDKNGIIWALATKNHTAPWSNPMEAGLLNITASSLMDDSTSLSAVVGRDTVRCVTKPLPNSWILLDFLADKRLLLTHYTMKHYSSWDTECVRCWRIEASNTGDVNNPYDWIVLREHTNDENLNGKGGTFTWSINGGDISNVIKQQVPFRYLRIIQTAENSNKHHYLPLSGLELYGKLLAADGVTPYSFGKPITNHGAHSHHAPAAVSNNLRQFKYQSNFDRNGILYWLATQNYTRNWVNPADAGLVRLTASSLNDDSEPISAIVGNAVVRCVTQAIPDQWFVIDFGPNKLIQPTAYSLRHYSSWDTEALRNWRFEGSTDPNPLTASWVRLSEHKDDASLDSKGATHTWQISTSRFYRMFRIFQFDKNSNKHHYLALSGFELYGTVKCDGDVFAPVPLSSALAPQLPPQQPLPPIPSSAALPLLAALPIASPAYLPVAPVVPPTVAPSLFAAPVSSAAFVHDAWDSEAKGAHLIVSPSTPTLVRNGGSQDKWQLARGRMAYATGTQKVSIKIAEDPNTSNTWRFIIGVVPSTLDCKGAKQWVGTMNSWGYIGGTGGKCHNTAVSGTYGSKYTQNDIVTIYMNFDAKLLGFFKNDEYQGTAFANLTGPVHVAASLTATDSALLIVPTPTNVTAQIAQMGPTGIPAPILAPLPALNIHAWDPANKSTSLAIDGVTGLLRNTGSNDKWQSCRSLRSFSAASGARQRFEIEFIDCPKTNNSWQFIVGVVPPSFTCFGNKQWVGAGESYGYIAGTGGTCFNQPKSIDYGEKYGKPGDIIGVQLDFEAGTIEFFKNGVSQGIAFTNLSGTVYAAVSLTATGSTAKLTILP